MFVYNLKLNSSFFYKILLGIIILVVIILCGIVGYKIYKASIKLNDDISNSDITQLTTQNYTNVLQSVHDNLDTYVGQKFRFSGFVYRVYDLNNDEFVLGRNMIISSDFQSVVVGFLCKYKDAIKLCDNTWIELEGKITKGKYHGNDIPILEVTNVRQIEKPNDEFVYPPDNNYIPTSTIL